MAASLYLLDTNAIIHLMRDTQGAVAHAYRARLRQAEPAAMATSIVVQCELAFGLLKRPSPKLQALYDIQMRALPVLPLDEAVTEHYALLRFTLEQQGISIGPHDMLIAAHAIAVGATLVTSDAEFLRVPGLTVENWLHPVP